MKYKYADECVYEGCLEPSQWIIRLEDGNRYACQDHLGLILKENSYYRQNKIIHIYENDHPATLDCNSQIGKAIGVLDAINTLANLLPSVVTNLGDQDVRKAISDLHSNETLYNLLMHGSLERKNTSQYKGELLGLDPSKNWQFRTAWPDVNGAHGGPLALMAVWENADKKDDSIMLVYRLSYCYGDSIPVIETPADIVKKDLHGRVYVVKAEDDPKYPRIDRCVYEIFVKGPSTFTNTGNKRQEEAE